MKTRGLLAAAALLSLLSACDKDKDVDPPAELVDVRPRIDVQRLWSVSVGGDAAALRLALGLASDGVRLYAASHDGEVLALRLDDGRQVWRSDTKLRLSAGPGVGDGLVVLGTNDGDLVALDAEDGKQRWRAKLSGEVLAAPLVAGDTVVVHTIDGNLRALAASDGRERWLVEEQVPRLSLRGSAAPVRSGDTVISGFDTGKVMAVSLASGDILWQSQVSTPRGRSELERLSDVDAAVRVDGDDVYAVGYQGRVTMLALDSGQVWWAREVSSYRALALDGEQLYVADSNGDMVAIRRRDGSVVWTQEGLKRRRLSGAGLLGDVVVVGDFEGYLHFLSHDSGEFVARERPGKAPISAAPLTVDGRLFVIDDAGRVAAYRIGT